VAMGTSADLVIHPAVALLIGSFAGTVSVFGFSRLQPWIERKFGLHDTCGIHNLHGMPGIIGGIAGVIASRIADEGLYGSSLNQIFIARELDPITGELGGRSASMQAWYQLAYLVITLTIAITGGLFSGFLVKHLFKAPKSFFLDDNHWEVPNLETPYYFDHRGEIVRGGGNAPYHANAPHSPEPSQPPHTLKHRKPASEPTASSSSSSHKKSHLPKSASNLSQPEQTQQQLQPFGAAAASYPLSLLDARLAAIELRLLSQQAQQSSPFPPPMAYYGHPGPHQPNVGNTPYGSNNNNNNNQNADVTALLQQLSMKMDRLTSNNDNS